MSQAWILRVTVNKIFFSKSKLTFCIIFATCKGNTMMNTRNTSLNSSHSTSRQQSAGEIVYNVKCARWTQRQKPGSSWDIQFFHMLFFIIFNLLQSHISSQYRYIHKPSCTFPKPDKHSVFIWSQFTPLYYTDPPT